MYDVEIPKRLHTAAKLNWINGWIALPFFLLELVDGIILIFAGYGILALVIDFLVILPIVGLGIYLWMIVKKREGFKNIRWVMITLMIIGGINALSDIPSFLFLLGIWEVIVVIFTIIAYSDTGVKSYIDDAIQYEENPGKKKKKGKKREEKDEDEYTIDVDYDDKPEKKTKTNKFCSECGESTSGEKKYCDNCGAKL